jgi:hypothetical protein
MPDHLFRHAHLLVLQLASYPFAHGTDRASVVRGGAVVGRPTVPAGKCGVPGLDGAELYLSEQQHLSAGLHLG